MQLSTPPQGDPALAAVPKPPTLVPSPDRRAVAGGLFGRNLKPTTLGWVSVEPDGTLRRHETANLAEFREKPYRRWWQYHVDEAMSAHIDPDGVLDLHGGGLVWHTTISLGLVLRAAPSETDPTRRERNPVAEAMIAMALDMSAPPDDLVFGPVAWIGDYDFGMNFYLPFTDVRLASLLDLHRAAKAAVRGGVS